MISIIIHASLLAFSLIVPLGVQNVFVFNQGAVQQRYVMALPVVLTAALCDMILIALAVSGLSLVLLIQDSIRVLLTCGGIVFLIVMGRATWRSEPAAAEEENKPITMRKQIIFAASVSLLNPHAILDTVGVIGTNSLQYTGQDKLVFAVTCMIVSLIWFTSLALAGRVIGRLDGSGRFIRIMNKLSAIMMWAIAVYMLVTLLL
ncbi:L-lysine exporter family protein LysE/ArgO [Paenibacillus phyllosphaerae]|uniref:L-lysine exporter family protein LysE/ArgO n=1 Tax=Paenibacillus phyllosphaerae TaxID=274593 RepID=A0A7W5AYT8_9BACL|nr:LysE/ArgO family amino acid transporter [Paenibacillus phyllosphaerae]MBB3111273.1 L-lysine exporter family protein LysE/ArgO [Paenibacillus phyllosphaerae]